MDNEVFTIETSPINGIVFDILIISVFLTIVAGIIGCVALLNAVDPKTRLKPVMH